MPDSQGKGLTVVAEGKPRDEVMKDIVGPELSRLLSPLFSPQPTLVDFPKIFCPETRTETAGVIEYVIHVTSKKLSSLMDEHPEEYDQLSDLSTARKDLFYRRPDSDEQQSIKETLREGVESGVVIPIGVAAHIQAIEKGSSKQTTDSKDAYVFEELVRVLDTSVVEGVLRRLTRGQNGFLGLMTASGIGAMSTESFFNFNDPDNPQNRLQTIDAYEAINGKVVGLGSKYFRAAQLQRECLRNMQRRHQSESLCKVVFTPTISSGCPARHTYGDKEGQAIEPLILVAKEYVSRVLHLALECGSFS